MAAGFDALNQDWFQHCAAGINASGIARRAGTDDKNLGFTCLRHSEAPERYVCSTVDIDAVMGVLNPLLWGKFVVIDLRENGWCRKKVAPVRNIIAQGCALI